MHAPLIRIGSILALLAGLVPALAQDAASQEGGGAFLKRKGEGWFWYQDPKDAPKPPPVVPPKPKPQTPAKAEKKVDPKDEPFSAKWLQENMPRLLEAAIDNPTKENVEAYLYAQRVAMDKSQMYAEKARQVVNSDPFLDENNRVPLSTYAKPAFLKGVEQGKSEALKHLSTVGGIWVFFDSKCSFCKPQIYSVQELARKHGFITKFVSVDGAGVPELPSFEKDNGHAKLLDLKITPTTVLVVPPNNYYVVSQGMMAESQLADRIVLAADSANLLPEPIATKVRSYDRGVLKPDDTKQGASSDPAQWVKYLKDRLQGRY